MSREFQIGDRVRHCVGRCGDVVGDMTDGEYPVMFEDGKTLGAAPKNLTLIRPACERPPVEGDRYECGSELRHLNRRTVDGWIVGIANVGDAPSTELGADFWVRQAIRTGTWRLKTPGKGSVGSASRESAASPDMTRATECVPTEPAPVFEVGGVLQYKDARSKFTLERTDGEWNYWQPFGKDRVEDNIKAIAEGRATYTPPAFVGDLSSFCDFLVALHAPPQVCVDCGKGPAREHYGDYTYCVYCLRRGLGTSERGPSAVAALPDKPGPHEGACAFATADWEWP